MSTQALDFDVIIVGAGAVGAAMAALLVARRLSAPGRVALIADHFTGPPPAHADWDLRVFALSRSSACSTCAVIRRRRSEFTPERMRLGTERRTSRPISALDCVEIGEPNLGTRRRTRPAMAVPASGAGPAPSRSRPKCLH